MPKAKPIKPEYIYYVYKASLVRIIDGDTLILSVDLGFHITMSLRFRLARINTAEINDPRVEIKELALRARYRLEELLKDGGQLTIRSFKPYREDKFGRYLADIYLATGECVNDTLLKEKLAVLYPAKF